MTKLYPQALEVNNNLWQGNVNLNSPSQKGHQQNCQCLFNLMVLVRGFDRRVFWWGQNERQFSERSSRKDSIWTTIFQLGGATTTYSRILLMKEIPAKKLACHSLDPACTKNPAKWVKLLINNTIVFLNFDLWKMTWIPLFGHVSVSDSLLSTWPEDAKTKVTVVIRCNTLQNESIGPWFRRKHVETSKLKTFLEGVVAMLGRVSLTTQKNWDLSPILRNATIQSLVEPPTMLPKEHNQRVWTCFKNSLWSPVLGGDFIYSTPPNTYMEPQRWRFERWCSFSNGWLSGIPNVFLGEFADMDDSLLG